MQQHGGCGFFVWYDPPMCHRSKQVIPGLLRKLTRLENEVTNTKRKQNVLCTIVVVSWVIVVVMGWFLLKANSKLKNEVNCMYLK